MEEIWRDIPLYDGQYQISSFGNFRSVYRKISRGKGFIPKIIYKNHLYKLFDCGGYLQVTAKQNNVQKTIKIHKLVAEVFIPNPNHYPEINHKNGISTDNRIENLEWCNRQQNMRHAHKMGLMNMERGEERYNVKLTDEKVKEIKMLREKNKISTRKLAKMFDISRSTILDILRERRWKHVK